MRKSFSVPRARRPDSGQPWYRAHWYRVHWYRVHWAALLSAGLSLACSSEKPPVQRPAQTPHAVAPAVTSNSATWRSAESAQRVAGAELATVLPLTSDDLPHESGVTGPVLNRDLLNLRYQAQVRILGPNDYLEDAEGRPPAASPTPDRQGPNGYQLGRFVPIQNERALIPFHERLERLATGRDRDGKVRVLVYGASHTQGDVFTSYLRYYLQSRFGNGGVGFVPLAKLNAWHRLLGFTIEEEGFKLQHSQRNYPEHGYLGLLGAASIGHARDAKVRITPKNQTDPELAASEYELSYGADKGAGDLILLVNDVPQMQLLGKANTIEDRFFRFRMTPGWHDIQVRPAGNGPARVYGVTIERPEPGVVIDTLGIGGARAASILDWNEGAWAAQVKHRDPALYILAFGTNEAVAAKESDDVYRAKLEQVLERFERALPGVSCLLVGPFDFPVETPQGYIPRTRLLEIIASQREIAAKHGCGFWDGYEFMGGTGSMHQWVLASPPLASPDHIHLNHRGYVRFGMSLADALMRAYDAYHLKVRDWAESH
jgi:lysophospholipase L1-like esterase